MKYKLRKDLNLDLGLKTLYRIEALQNFSDVKKGELGGYIEEEYNLSQNGDCWIYGNARVYGDALVSGNAQVYGDAHVYDYALVYDYAQVYDYARVSGNTRVNNSMRISSDKDLIYISGVKHDISISLTGINIGCKHYKDLKDFMSRVDKEADENEYTEIEKKHLIKLINMNIDYLNEIRG